MSEGFLTEAVGIVGAVAILLAYGLNSYGKITPNSWCFVLLNMLGAGSLIVYSLVKEAWSNVFINVVWVVIAIGTAVRVLRRKNDV